MAQAVRDARLPYRFDADMPLFPRGFIVDRAAQAVLGGTANALDEELIVEAYAIVVENAARMLEAPSPYDRPKEGTRTYASKLYLAGVAVVGRSK